ncbi:hypothetical protein RJ639_041407 [Escallonia herrerae]|uniref:K-box domain-containing protein n=1 Tax=Escallonia herrerae TaxID=1293975 RepID=A0AA88WIF9_9ASTE|nr:hypothetical protein RJ639_041407 [Escallonia herrerae]
MALLSDSIEEINKLKHEIEVLQKGLGYMCGRGTGIMSLDELHVLEQTLEVSIYHIRSAKMDIMSQEIESLKNEVGMLDSANQYLQEKVGEHYGITDMTPVVTNIPYPLTILNEIYQF